MKISIFYADREQEAKQHNINYTLTLVNGRRAMLLSEEAGSSEPDGVLTPNILSI